MKLAPRIATLALLAGLAASTQAAPVNGTISFSFNSINLVDSSNNASTFAAATGFTFAGSPDATVASTTGDFVYIVNSQPIDFSNFQFNPLGPTPPTLIWTHNGTATTNFFLSSVTNITQNANVLQVDGVGYVTDGAGGFDDTIGTFTIFGAGSSQSSFSFSSSSVTTPAGVPDGGSLLVMVGLGLASLLGLQRGVATRR
jgi:hypothetical protein